MATRTPQTSSNRPGNNGGSGVRGNPVDVGHAAVVRMAREDARWFIAAVVVLSVVLFFALPMSLLIYIDTARLQAEVRYEVKQLKKLQQKASKNHDNTVEDYKETQPSK